MACVRNLRWSRSKFLVITVGLQETWSQESQFTFGPEAARRSWANQTVLHGRLPNMQLNYMHLSRDHSLALSLSLARFKFVHTSVCISVCLSVCMWARLCISISACRYVYYMYVCSLPVECKCQKRMYVCMYLCMYVYVCVCVYVCVYVCMYVYVCMHACMLHACMCICACVYVRTYEYRHACMDGCRSK